MLLITDLSEDFNIVTEERNGKKTYHIHGIMMQAECKNKNGRIYPLPILEKECDRYVRDYVGKNRAVGELGHPTGPTINPDRISHKITELRRDGNNFVGKAKILESQPYGKIVKGLLDEGIQLGVSSRGIGSLQERDGVNYVGEDFYLSTIDIVMDPSAPDAFVNGIMEGREYVWDNGALREIDLELARRHVNSGARRHDTEQAMLEAFERLMSGFRDWKV